ncbi:DUF5336 domain-containing protein [Gordonia humi]|uniref:Uncharacterized protein n=1 Tax=Gordonia humi TaxID=686429 RepID=A0A840F1J7_9ACTN|nr:DUF5336 domain-containing protein [Gordonia humi]MBB4137742.1 hypothetical protein [Gordonia humi]
MSYPQSGGYGYGQNQQGQQPYGQQADYGQQYGGQYGQQQGYDAQAQAAAQQQAQYGQQYQQQAQYGYGAPAAPANPGLPANTPTILAAVIGALGVITLFCGFLGAYSAPDGYSGAVPKLFESSYVGPYVLVALAGLIALTTFVLGVEKWVVGSVFAATVVAAFVTIFQFATQDGGRGVGAIILLITAILSAVAAVVWLLVAGGQVKLADAVADPAAVAQQQAAQQQAAPQAPAVDYGYGYGYGQQAPAQHTPAPQSAAQPAQAQPAQYAQTQYGQPAQQAPAGDSNATTAFVKPPTDPGTATPNLDK